jgi:phage shock protein PspC (stress-responsive transcriptional regulator)
MNKVITINLNGVAYQLEEGGYDALRAYLDHAARRLEGNPDKDEIITDIEQAIADKFRALLGAYKTVVNTKEVAGVIAEMGPVQDGTGGGAEDNPQATEGKQPASATGSGAAGDAASAAPRRLYKITDGAMLAGVCNGLAAYLNTDVTAIRLAFVLMTLLWGVGAMVYLVLAVIVPQARTPAEKAAASGAAATAQEFIKRAREGYYAGMKTWHDRHARGAWKRKFRQEMRGWKHNIRSEMHANAQQWQQNWPQPTPPIFGPVFIAPLLSLLLLGLACVMVYAIYSVVTVHAVFGLVLPLTMPVWVAILLVVFAYLLAAWPIKAMRWACYFPGPHHGYHGPFGGFFGSLVGFFFLGFGLWMLNRHVPEFHEWLEQLPNLLHQLIDTIQGWFTQHK